MPAVRRLQVQASRVLRLQEALKSQERQALPRQQEPVAQSREPRLVLLREWGQLELGLLLVASARHAKLRQQASRHVRSALPLREDAR